MVRLLTGIGIVMVLVVSCMGEETREDRFDDDGSAAQGAGPTTGVGGAGVVTGVGGAGGAPVTSSTTASGGDPVTTSSSSSGTPCNDPGPEPNNNIQEAAYLGAINDCDSNALNFSGVLSGNDVDWFQYDGSDAIGCVVNPSRSVTADSQVRICKFLDCVTGTPEFTCPDGSTPDSAGGLDGCCAAGELSFDAGCSDTGDDAMLVYLRLDKPSGIPCVNYSVTFHY